MKHVPLNTPSVALLPELQTELARIRTARAFDPVTYLDKKVELIRSYYETHKLKGAVLGLSGGIDSAVVLGILLTVHGRYPETLRDIRPLILPTFTAEIGQTEAAQRAINLCEQWNVDFDIIHLYDAATDIHQRMTGRAFAVDQTGWARGQLTSNIRTPALYYATSLLTAAGIPSIVVGTTNRDEGSYLGYVGKASDGMVDLQIIADLHKSEVRALAVHLGVHQSIMDATPAGEMYDGRVDEEVFGAPYDFVELLLGWRVEIANEQRCIDMRPYPLPSWWSKEAVDQYRALETNVEALHRYNQHKYLVGSPAIHLNVLESAVPGGWTR